MTPETLWEATGIAKPDAPPLPGDLSVDVAVIGAGYSGLNAALELAGRGAQPVVLDALPLGKGASGRSGGFIAGRFRMPPPVVLKRYGPAMVELMQKISLASVAQVESNVTELGIPEARFKRHGNIRGAISKTHFDRMKAEAGRQVAADFGASTQQRLLDRDELEALTGTNQFFGGTVNPSVPGLHPFNYTMGLARALTQRGVAIHAETPVTQIVEAGNGVELITPRGTVRARQVVVATDAYSRLTGIKTPLAKGIIPFRSCAIATAPLPPEMAAKILPQDHMLVDTRRVLRWVRLIDGRLVIGGRGAGRESQDKQAYRAMHRHLTGMFPQAAGLPIDYRWSGYVGMTLDQLPHVGRASERVVFAGGYNGNGVALASLFGRYAARLALRDEVELGILGGSWLRPVPIYPLSIPGARLAARYMQVLDSLGI